VAARTLADIEAAFRSAWSVETCDPVDVPGWTPDNPARGQCGATALTLLELVGGELLEAEVRYPDGTRQGYHYWNRLAGGVEIDLTAEQFGPDEAIQAPTVVTVPEAPPSRAGEQYALLRRRVLTALDLDPDERRLDPDEQAFPGNRTATS
jgi:hypothetical protein